MTFIMSYRKLSSIVALLMLCLAGCRTAVPHTDPTGSQADFASAVKHYEAEDIPDSDILKMFQQLAQNGDVCATMWIARFYELGRCSLPRRPALAQEMAAGVIGQVKKIARNGDVDAQFALASAYHLGMGVPQ